MYVLKAIDAPAHADHTIGRYVRRATSLVPMRDKPTVYKTIEAAQSGLDKIRPGWGPGWNVVIVPSSEVPALNAKP